MEVLSTGEKIKKLRIDIGLKQDDLTNEEITRSLISMIENNKRALTVGTAKVIAAAFNKYYKNLGKEITPDYLLESEAEQVKRIITHKLEEMQLILKKPKYANEEQVKESFEKLIIMAQQWDLEEVLADLYFIRGDFYYNIYQYNQALNDYFYAQEFYLRKAQFDKVASLYNSIGCCHHHLMLIDQALLYYNRAYDTITVYQTNNYENMKMHLVFDQVLCYRILKKYDMALKLIASFKELSYYNEEYYHQILLLEANTYCDIQNYERAAKIYDKLLNKANRLSADTIVLIYMNYAKMYEKINNHEKSIFYIETAFNYKDEIQPYYLPNLFYNKAKSYFALNKTEEAISLIQKGLSLAEKVTKIEMVLKLYFLLVEIKITNGNFSEAEDHLLYVEKYVMDSNIEDKCIDVYTYFIELYTKANNIKKCLEYVAKLRGLRNVG